MWSAVSCAEEPGFDAGAALAGKPDGKRDHAAQAGELEDQVKTYAGQVQALALERSAPGVSQLHPHRRPGDK
jgi:hypothetical protein